MKIEKINNPKDLKKLTIDELPELSAEIRDIIIDTVLQNGGHLASNLGVVELTIALHYIFDAPKDSIIFDVSHQCYTHKLLTGRKDKFDTIRQKGGLSGFTNKYESEYDIFTSGHAGTSISTALGISCANEIQGNNNKTIAVVGDASIACGMAFEALNHTGHIQNDLIIVLNDNNMSISKTIGSLSKYFEKISLTKAYTNLKKDIHKSFAKIPLIGKKLDYFVKKVKNTVKYATIPGHIFEELGLKYYGPINGHNYNELISALTRIKEQNRPILLHILTEKGYGYEKASKNPTKFHGLNPASDYVLDKLNGKNNSISYSQIFGEHLVELAEENEQMVAVTAAMPDGTGLKFFKRKFPKRYFDVGICEQHAIGIAAGLSTKGMIPVVAIYSTFLQRAYDQIVHDICLQNLHCIFIIDRAGIVGYDGATHHGNFDIAYLRHLPNMIICSPKDHQELLEMLDLSLNVDQPIAIRFPKMKVPVENMALKKDFKKLEIGKSEVVKEGNDALIFCFGPILESVRKATELLKNEDLSFKIVNLRFIKPLDSELIIGSIKDFKHIFIIEEHTKIGGCYSAILECLSENGINLADKEFHSINIPDKFIEHGSRGEILEEIGLDANSICHLLKTKIRPDKNF